VSSQCASLRPTGSWTRKWAATPKDAGRPLPTPRSPQINQYSVWLAEAAAATVVCQPRPVIHTSNANLPTIAGRQNDRRPVTIIAVDSGASLQLSSRPYTDRPFE